MILAVASAAYNKLTGKCPSAAWHLGKDLECKNAGYGPPLPPAYIQTLHSLSIPWVPEVFFPLEATELSGEAANGEREDL